MTSRAYRWDSGQLRGLARQYEAGATFERLALQEGCTATAIRKALSGLVVPRRCGPQRGSTYRSRR